MSDQLVPMNINRLRAYRDQPGPETQRLAVELLSRCGPLACDGMVYELDGDVIKTSPWYTHGSPGSRGLGKRALALMLRERAASR